MSRRLFAIHPDIQFEDEDDSYTTLVSSFDEIAREIREGYADADNIIVYHAERVEIALDVTDLVSDGLSEYGIWDARDLLDKFKDQLAVIQVDLDRVCKELSNVVWTVSDRVIDSRTVERELEAANQRYEDAMNSKPNKNQLALDLKGGA